MYNNPYMANLNQQNINDRIDSEIERLKQMKTNMQQPIQPITQNFQLAPTNNHTIRYANTIDDVNKEAVYYDTPFFSKDMSVMWLKNGKGEIKSYELNEIVLKDDKDIMIENLQAQINELKGMIKNESDSNADESVESEKSNDVSNVKSSTKKSK